MLAAKLLSNICPLRQTLGPTTCKALAHTDIHIPDNPAYRDSKSKKKNKAGEAELAQVYFKQFSNYSRMITDAKLRAKRSILVDHCGLKHIDLLEQFHNVEHVYNIERESKRGLSQLSLIEFKTEKDAENIAKQARHNEGLLPVPLKIFRYIGNVVPPPDEKKLGFPVDNVKISYKRELSTEFKTYSQLLENNMMSLIALKMRFITLVNFERILCAGMFEEYELLPFGSSVIDLGCDFGDLDLLVTPKDENLINSDLTTGSYMTEKNSSKLVHLDKSLYSEIKDKSGIRGTMRWFDHILREYMPLTDGYGVVFVRHAKVPIIKFTSRITNIDCDLSFNLGLDHRERSTMSFNNPGIKMAQILFTLCRNNNLFTAVAIYLRIFGKLSEITSKEPNIGLTNFQYLSLIIFYLQQISIEQTSKGPEKSYTILLENKHLPSNSQTIVPPFKELSSNNLESKNLIYSNDELNEIVPKLIEGFLNFYSDFNFHGNSLNLHLGKLERKLDNSTIYVQNPLDLNQNVCHNVTRRGVDHFVRQVRLARIGIKQGEQFNCPLTLIRHLMVKYNQQPKKSKQLRFTTDGVYVDSQDRYGTSEGVAQDICR